MNTMSMLVIEQKQGQQFVNKGDRVCDIQIILSGKVEMRTANDAFILEAGSVIGLMESTVGRYISDYVAVENTLIVTYAYESIEDLNRIFDEHPQYIYAFLHANTVLAQSVLKRYQELLLVSKAVYLFIMKQFREYSLFCDQYGIEALSVSGQSQLKPVVLPKTIHQWELVYVNELLTQSAEIMKQFYIEKQGLCIGEINRESELMISAIQNMERIIAYNIQKTKLLLGQEKQDIFSCWFDLAKRLSSMDNDIEAVNKKVRELQEFVQNRQLFPQEEIEAAFSSYWNFDFKGCAGSSKSSGKGKRQKAKEQEFDYFEYIINYVDYEEEQKKQYRELLEQYLTVIIKKTQGDEATDIFDRVSAMFFDIYEKAFFKTVESKEEVSPMLQLFFQFGFMDPRLVGRDNVKLLFMLNQKVSNEVSDHVFSMYEWLHMIYIGIRDTSKNEFDLDYEGWLREMRKVNRITADEEKSLQYDRRNMVRFELENMFRAASKGTFGDMGIYSPVLTGQVLTMSPDTMFMSADKIQKALDNIREIDFGCFYREIMFYDLENETEHMLIQKEVLPDIIITPNAGNRALMWQATEHGMRESAARFLFPVFSAGDLDELMLDVVARYRWDICKNIQGNKWKDISEHSLTAEYYDYMEHYRSNVHISSDTKNKIKTLITRAKGDYREIFVIDYINWIKYESKGNFRLNKVSRDILSRYCPFNKEIRNKLMDNPMFRNVFTKYDEIMSKKQIQIKNTLSHYKHSGGELTDELLNHLEFYKR